MAHGLVLKLEEMLQRNLVSRKDYYEITSEENKIIQSWLIGSNQPRFCKLEFLRLMRKTLVFMFSHHGLREPQRKELLRGVTLYFNTFSSILRNQMDFRKHIIDVIIDPWKNQSFSWDEFFQHKTSVYDKKVKSYFASEHEEVVMARVHAFMIQGKEDLAMILAKCSYLFHSRIAKSLFVTDAQGNRVRPQSLILNTKNRRGIASMDWYLFILQRKNMLSAIVDELKQLTCHEGVQLVHRLRRRKQNQGFIFTILQTLIMLELVKPSKFCCTKKLFSLWCFMHKEKKSGFVEMNKAIRKMLAVYSPTSAHFYLFADALWEQFGSNYVPLYVELYVRGLTVDINHLEAVKHREDKENTTFLECHIANIFAKLSTLFSDFHEGAARECMFSAFSLKPTKERLYILQSLTHSILSSENEMKVVYPMKSSAECKCNVRCHGACKVVKDYFLEHPVLKKGICNVPFMLVKDLVTVLEGVRCIQFQYNLFDWHNNATDLGDYLKDYNMLKSWDSDTEYASDESLIDDGSPEKSVTQINQFPISERSLHVPVKRKGSSSASREYSQDFAASINVGNDDSKKIKLEDQDIAKKINIHDMINKPFNPVPGFSSGVEMEDAIENVIRMTLDKKRPDLLNNNFINTALNRTNEGMQIVRLSSANMRALENRVHPYSLTSSAKGADLNSDLNSPEYLSTKSSSGNTNEHVQKFSLSTSKGATITHSGSRESVISPVNPFKHVTLQAQARQQVVLNQPFSVQTVKVPGISHSKARKAANFSSHQKTSVSTYQQILSEMGLKSTLDGLNSQSKALISPFVSSQRYNMQPAHSSSFGFSNSQIASNSHTSFTSPMANPINLSQTKESTEQQGTCASTSQSSVSESEQYMDISPVNDSVVNYKNHEISHLDRSSVIQHTMHVMGENSVSQRKLEIPNPVSINQNIAQQISFAPKKNLTNLPPFRVNVDRTISNAPMAVSANLVIQRKSLPVEMSETVNSNASCNSETITIPGILASSSVIVSPWEATQKKHGDMLYKKTTNSVCSSPGEKRIYRHRPNNITEPNDVNKNVSPHALQSLASTQIKPIISHSTSIPNSNQTIEGKPTSNTTMPSPSQPWYSAPYPKLNDCDSVKVNSAGNISLSPSNPPAKNAQTTKLPNVKSTAIYRKVHPSSYKPKGVSRLLNNNAAVSSTNLNQPIKPQPLHITNDYSQTRDQKIKNVSVPPRSKPGCSNNNRFSPSHSTPPSNSTSQYRNIADIARNYASQQKNPIVFTPSPNLNRQSCHTSPGNFPRVCCSPTETTPCQNCSLPKTDANLVQSPVGQNAECVSEQQSVTSTKKSVADITAPSFCSTNASLPIDSNTRIGNSGSSVNDTVIKCPFCLQLFHSSDLEIHIVTTHSKDLNTSNFNSAVNENLSVPMKVLPDVVPEQDTLFQKDSLQNDLPHTKSFENYGNQLHIPEDGKNLDIIDANAFSACMDLINSDKDLTRIVEVIDSLDQMDNNYLQFPDTNNFFSSNMCNEIEKADLLDTPLQDVTGEKNEMSKYTMQLNNTQSADKMNTTKNVFDFTSETTQKEHKNSLNFNYGETPFDYGDKPAVKSPNKNALTFSELAQMIKATINNDGNCNAVETFEAGMNNYCEATLPQVTHFQNDKMNAIYDTGSPQHKTITSLKEPIPAETEKQKNQCKYCHLKFRFLAKHKCKVLQTLVKSGELLPTALPCKTNLKSMCSICGKSLSQSNMKKHMLSKHKLESSQLLNCEQQNQVIYSEQQDVAVDIKQQHKVKHIEIQKLNSKQTAVTNILNDKDCRNIVPISQNFVRHQSECKTKKQSTECKLCGKKLMTSSMRKHMQNKHSDQQHQEMHSEQQHQGIDQQHQGIDQQHQGMHSEQQHQGLHNEQQHQGLHIEQQHQGLHNEQQHQGMHSEQQHQGMHSEQQHQGLQDNKQRLQIIVNAKISELQNKIKPHLENNRPSIDDDSLIHANAELKSTTPLPVRKNLVYRFKKSQQQTRCNICGKSLIISSLKRHMLQHTKQKIISKNIKFENQVEHYQHTEQQHDIVQSKNRHQGMNIEQKCQEMPSDQQHQGMHSEQEYPGRHSDQQYQGLHGSIQQVLHSKSDNKSGLQNEILSPKGSGPDCFLILDNTEHKLSASLSVYQNSAGRYRKSQQKTECEVCGKSLTRACLKRHMLHKHSEQKIQYINTEIKNKVACNQLIGQQHEVVQNEDQNHVMQNDQQLPIVPVRCEDPCSPETEATNSSNTRDKKIFNTSQLHNTSLMSLSTLHEPDIDSSTCLSISDALKRNSSYNIADASNLSVDYGKMSNNTNVKFNFDAIEFSKAPQGNENISTTETHCTPEHIKETKVNQENATEPNEKEVFPEQHLKNINKQSLKSYKCNFCPKVFTYKGNINRHVKKKHKVEFDQQQIVKLAAATTGSNLTIKKVVDSKKVSPTAHSAKKQLKDYLNDKNINLQTTQIKNELDEKPKKCLPKFDNLLKAVLKSNLTKSFQKTDLLKQEHQYICSDVEQNVYAAPTYYNDELSPNMSACEEHKALEMDHALASSKVLPPENFLTSQPNLAPLICEANVFNTPIGQTEMECFENNIINDGKVFQMLDLNHTNSQHTDHENLNVHSSEISPVTKIISNVSKCNFTVASKIEDERCLDENSLKLLIPENHEQIETNEFIKQNTSITLLESNDTAISHCSFLPIMPEYNLSTSLQKNDFSCTSKSNLDSFPNVQCANSFGEVILNSYQIGNMQSNTEGLIYKQNNINVLGIEEIKCKLCGQIFCSMTLSKHLNDVHNVPVLEKQVLEQYSVCITTNAEETVASPPNLNLENESVTNITPINVTAFNDSSKTLDKGTINNSMSPLQCTLKNSYFCPKLEGLLDSGHKSQQPNQHGFESSCVSASSPTYVLEKDVPISSIQFIGENASIGASKDMKTYQSKSSICNQELNAVPNAKLPFESNYDVSTSIADSNVFLEMCDKVDNGKNSVEVPVSSEQNIEENISNFHSDNSALNLKNNAKLFEPEQSKSIQESEIGTNSNANKINSNAISNFVYDSVFLVGFNKDDDAQNSHLSHPSSKQLLKDELYTSLHADNCLQKSSPLVSTENVKRFESESSRSAHEFENQTCSISGSNVNETISKISSNSDIVSTCIKDCCVFLGTCDKEDIASNLSIETHLTEEFKRDKSTSFCSPPEQYLPDNIEQKSCKKMSELPVTENATLSNSTINASNLELASTTNNNYLSSIDLIEKETIVESGSSEESAERNVTTYITSIEQQSVHESESNKSDLSISLCKQKSKSLLADSSDSDIVETGLCVTPQSPEHQIKEDIAIFHTSQNQNQEITASGDMEYLEQLSSQSSSLFDSEMLSNSNHDSSESQTCTSLNVDAVNNLPVMSNICMPEKSACDNIQSSSLQENYIVQSKHLGIRSEQKHFNSFHFDSSCTGCLMKASPCKFHLRRHSISDTNSFFHQLKNNLKTTNIKQSISNMGVKTKSVSLPNFQVALKLLTVSSIENELCKAAKSVYSMVHKDFTSPLMENGVTVLQTIKTESCSSVIGECIEQLMKDVKVEECSDGENISSNVKEEGETSCDMSSKISSKNNYMHSYSNPCSQISKYKTISKVTKVGKKTSHSKLFQKMKTYKTHKRISKSSKCFCCQKNLISRKKNKSIIATYEKNTDILDFLKTHKQPIVKLRRIDDDYVQCKKRPSNNNKTCIKEAVVKLEKLHVLKNGSIEELSTSINSVPSAKPHRNINSKLQSKQSPNFFSGKSHKNINFKLQSEQCQNFILNGKLHKNINSKLQSKQSPNYVPTGKPHKNINFKLKSKLCQNFVPSPKPHKNINSKLQSKLSPKYVPSGKPHKNINSKLKNRQCSKFVPSGKSHKNNNSKLQSKQCSNYVPSAKSHRIISKLQSKQCPKFIPSVKPHRYRSSLSVRKAKLKIEKYRNGFHFCTNRPIRSETIRRQAVSPVIIDLTDSNDCDSKISSDKFAVQNVQTVVSKEACLIKTVQTSVPLTKKCFVLLKRISV